MVTRRAFMASLAAPAAMGISSQTHSRQRSSDPLAFLQSPTGATIGEPNAPVKMHVFNDFQSHYGRDFYFQTVPFIMEDFVVADDVTLILHDFPRLGTDAEIADPDNLLVELADPRNESSLAAQAAMSAGDQGKYIHMSDRLFGSYKELQSGTFLRKNLNRMALAIDLDFAEFEEGMDSGKHLQAIADSITQAQELGITATPMFILDNGDGDPNVIQNTAEGYGLLKRQIQLAVDTAR